MNSKQTTHLAKVLRCSSTPAERVLWLKLRNKQFEGVKFRRQQPLGSYIVDFVSFDNKLVIEIDGGQHNEDSTIEIDRARTDWLKSQGFQVIRFWNNEILENLEGVLIKIKETLEKNDPSSKSSPTEGRRNGIGWVNLLQHQQEVLKSIP
jgi:very-short-patch-repair endonuclease